MDLKTHWNNWLAGVRLTDWLLVAFTFVLAVVAGLQWHEMQTGGIDTKRLADEATLSAEAASKSAAAAQSFAMSAGAIAEGVSSTANSLLMRRTA